MNMAPSGRARLVVVFLLALTVRVLFAVFLAGPFWNRADFRIDQDTRVFFTAGSNLVTLGTLTCNPGNDYGAFCRMPGYPLFLAALSGFVANDEARTYILASRLQVILDSIAAVLFAIAAVNGFIRERTGAIVGILYATYPFVVAWSPVAMSEILAIDLLVLALFLLVRPASSVRTTALAGVVLAASALTRPQILLFAPLAAVLAFHFPGRVGSGRRRALLFLLAFVAVYGQWPLRNLVFHGKPIVTQDLRGWPTPLWQDDTLAYLGYIYSVKEDWQPQFGQILAGGDVQWPEAATAIAGDDRELGRAIELARRCGNGFRSWPDFRGPASSEPECTAEVARIFNRLRERQMHLNPWHYWVQVPLANLEKGVFKSALANQTARLRHLAARALFPYRTALILVGLLGGLVLLARPDAPGRALGFFCLAGFGGLYLTLCAGSGAQMRNIEMRYLLPADILLLMPAAWGLEAILTAALPRLRTAVNTVLSFDSGAK